MDSIIKMFTCFPRDLVVLITLALAGYDRKSFIIHLRLTLESQDIHLFGGMLLFVLYCFIL